MQSVRKLHPVETLDEFEDQLFQQIESKSISQYEPTGLQEDVIFAVGCGKYEIILALHPNDVGKTTAGTQICKNIFWDYDPTWFSWWKGYSIFKDKIFPLKSFRITAQHTNLAETGAIQTEINRWWPRGRFQWEKGGQHYPSKCRTDTGWMGDALSYNQSREEHESKKVSFLWSDEPPPADLLGAMTSRFAEGMLWLITATPIKCGAFLDVIQDMIDSGTRVKQLSGTAAENSITDGKPNHLGTKKGLRTNEEIKSKIARCPKEEQDARIYGKPSRKSGKIYSDFDRNVHVRFWDMSLPQIKLWNTYMFMDPHPKYYPFIQWWAVTPEEYRICLNEWPTFEMFGNYYDEVRDTLVCPYDAEAIAQFIKIYDGTQYGLEAPKRYLDPYFAFSGGGSAGESRTTESLQSQYVKYDIKFDIPPRELIETQREEIRRLLKYDLQKPICANNEPKIFYMPHCVNSIRMMERHSWDDEHECEAQRYKEGPDCTRGFLAAYGNRGYIKKENKIITLNNQNSVLQNYIKNMPEISLG